MKTYSVCIKNVVGDWITNWGKHFNLSDINWDDVKGFCEKRGDLAYGYMFGTDSRNLTSSRCRTVLWEREN